LLEILLVLALIAILAVAVIPRAQGLFRVSVQSSVRRFGSMVRYAYDQAIFTGRLHRIVLDLDKQTWAVEAAPKGKLPVEEARRERFEGLPDNKHNDDEEEAGPDGKKKDKFGADFQPIGKGLLGPLPKGVQLIEVESWRAGKGPVKKGQVSIYAFPNGFMDEAEVVLAEQGQEQVQQFHVKVQPLTGRIKVETEAGKP
jgi:type II secretory pathway pseudopilin PulG